MQIFDNTANGIVIAGMFYLTIVMALAGWVASLRRGQAVTLLPARGNRAWPAWVQLGLVLVALVLSVLFLYFLWIPLPVSLSSTTSLVLKAGGLLLFLAGLGLTVWARRALGVMWGISTSRQVKLMPNHQLIQRGPYAWVRHPMYLGWWVSLLGLILIYRTWVLVALLVMSVASFYRRARLEEATLAARFGAEWQSYTARSKFLIPFFY